jgi:Zn-dependent alcohol dehydrogenase
MMTNKTARAAVFRPGTDMAQLETLKIGELRSDEVLVKLVATGICHTDLTCRNGFMPMPRPIVLGHEGAGIVEAIGQGVTEVKPGTRVVLIKGRTRLLLPVHGRQHDRAASRRQYRTFFRQR